MPLSPQLTWSDAEDLGIALADMYPEQNPLEVRFTELKRMVTELPVFEDDPNGCNEPKLEAIQMAWHEEYISRR